MSLVARDEQNALFLWASFQAQDLAEGTSLSWIAA
jgi:hypothetical protein